MAWWAAYIGLTYDRAHCWELVRRVYADRLGIDLPTYAEIDARNLAAVSRVMQSDAQGEAWQAVSDPRAFDVVLLSGRSRVAHVGVMVDATRVLHTEKATGCVLVQVTNPLIAGRVLGYRRHVSQVLSE
jgi:cell wall-associated NlpC family hydrolase